jgi:hypothetical protein
MLTLLKSFVAETRRRVRLKRLEKIEEILLTHPQVKTEITHHFAPGIYVREMRAPAGSGILGHEHTTEHLNILLAGSVLIEVEGQSVILTAPAIIKSPAGTRKIAAVVEDVRWLNIHASPETDISALEAMLYKKSKTYLAHEAKTEALK